MTKQIFSALKVSLLALFLSFGLSFVYAWTAPTATPPVGNVSAPINTSAAIQSISGRLGVGMTTAPTSILEVHSGTTYSNPQFTSHIKFNDNFGGGALGVSGVATPANRISLATGTSTLTERLSINQTSGNVGIGTTNPLSTLSVGGNGLAQTGVYGTGKSNGVYGSSTDIGVRANGDNYGVFVDSVNTGIRSYGGYTGIDSTGAGIGVYSYAQGSATVTALADFYGGHGEKTVGGVWTNVASYRRYKENFSSTKGYLDKLMNLDMYEWQYKNEVIDGLNRYKSDPYRHASPFLDDFYNTFKLGTNDGYNIQDLAGVTISSVKELNKKVIAENKALNEKIEIQQKQMDALIARIEKLEVAK